MDKLQVIQRAKSYMDMLSKGIDPISGESVPEDSTLQQERLKKCFSFVSEILDELMATNGVVAMPTTEHSQGYLVMKKKAEFSIDQQQKSSIKITNAPIIPSAFIKNINSAVNAETMEKLSLVTVSKWLMKQGYLSETKVPTVINKNVKTVTPRSAQIGVVEQTVVDSKTGEAKAQLLFTRQAQEFILENISAIVGEK